MTYGKLWHMAPSLYRNKHNQKLDWFWCECGEICLKYFWKVKTAGYPQGIIGQANVPPSGTQYRSDRIPPAYDVYKRDKQRSFLTLVEILNVLRSLGWHKS